MHARMIKGAVALTLALTSMAMVVSADPVATQAAAAAPVTLMVQTRFQGLAQVAVSSDTRIMRRYGDLSSLDEFSANDVLHIEGSPTTVGDPHTITASQIRDDSIQEAYTRLVGQVTSFTATSVSIVVQRDATSHSPFITGENLTLPIGPSTKVTGTLATGARIVALGVFDSAHHTFTTTVRIRVL